MVTIQGIGGLPEPKSDRTEKVRSEREAEAASKAASGSASQASDDVVISSEARAAAEIAKIIRTSAMQSEIRADKVAAAKDSLERGDYKKPEVVAKVAERISKYIS